jgi:hypothetical protein
MRPIHLILTVVTLVGCAPSFNLKNNSISPLGGGFLDYKLDEGMFEIIAKSNAAPWGNIDTATKTWKDRADTLCGTGQYREFDIQEGETELSPIGIQIIRRGFAVCNSANMTDADVRERFRKKARGLVFDIPAETPEPTPANITSPKE